MNFALIYVNPLMQITQNKFWRENNNGGPVRLGPNVSNVIDQFSRLLLQYARAHTTEL